MTRYYTARDLPSKPVSLRQDPRHLRVLHVDAARQWRGGERQLLLLATGMRERGAEPLVAAQPGSPLLQKLKAEGIATASLAMRSDLDLLAVRRLRRLIATWRPDVMHAHDRRGHALALAALIGRRASVPLMVTCRIVARPRGLVRFGPRVARFIAISGAVRDALVSGGIAGERVTVAYPGVSPSLEGRPRDWRRECGWDESTLLAGVIGPLTGDAASARLATLLRTIPRDAAARMGLVVLGGHARGTGEIGGVRAFRAGFVHDVPQAIAGLDLLLHPGGAEGLGTAVIEGMALGVPTVAVAAGGLGEIIEDGRNGLLVPPDDDAAFARGVAGLVGDPIQRRALGAGGPERARSFGPDRMVDTILAAYRDLMERSTV